MKDYPKPPWVSNYVAQGKLILQGGFMAEIGAQNSETSNLLKMNYKINNKIVDCLLDLKKQIHSWPHKRQSDWDQNQISGRPYHGAIGTKHN